jgi:hypothetical protein
MKITGNLDEEQYSFLLYLLKFFLKSYPVTDPKAQRGGGVEV